MVSLALRLFKWCKSYFWLSRTRTSRIYDFTCIVLVVVLVLDTILRKLPHHLLLDDRIPQL